MAAVIVTMACGSDTAPKAGLLIALDTQLTVPREVARVGLYIQHQHDGRNDLLLSQEVTPICTATGCSVTFASTFAVQSSVSVDSNDRIRSRFVGYAPDGSALAMREARTAIPTADVRQLRLPLLFINANRVEDTSNAEVAPTRSAVGLRADAATSDVFSRFRMQGCKVDETLGDDGACASIDIPLEALPTGEALSPAASCFDVNACFGSERGVLEVALGTSCTIPLPTTRADSVAVAVAADGGYVTSRGNVHPLDRCSPAPTSCARASKRSAARSTRSAACASRPQQTFTSTSTST